MKKYIYLFALLTLAVFTSCLDEDESESKLTLNATLNCRAVDLEQGTVAFSQNNNSKIEINYTNQTIQFNTTYKDLDGITQTVNTPVMKLKQVGNTMVYLIHDNNNVTHGYFDIGTNMMWYDLSQSLQDGHVNATYEAVYITTQLIYAYTTTVVSDESGANYEHQKSAYLFLLDARGETCTLQITNFIPDVNGSVQASVIEYKGLTVTPTSLGYVITANEVESSYSGFYTITDLNFTLDAECNVINGTFKSGEHNYKVTGNLFGYTN